MIQGRASPRKRATNKLVEGGGGGRGATVVPGTGHLPRKFAHCLPTIYSIDTRRQRNNKTPPVMERSFTWQQQQQSDDRLAAITPFYWSRHRCDSSAPAGRTNLQIIGENRLIVRSKTRSVHPRHCLEQFAIALSATRWRQGRWILSSNGQTRKNLSERTHVLFDCLWRGGDRHDDNVEEGREEGLEEVEEERREDVRSEREDGEAGSREEKWTESASRYCVQLETF